MENIFRKVEQGIDGLFGGEKHSHTHDGHECEHPAAAGTVNRHGSFAPQSAGSVKWYVDGCSYFWAVSQALEAARESIYIMDWWLTPELYLRRPPSRNEQYRLDNMLKAAAERGVQVRVIVYKEVPQALTLNSEHTKHALEALHPNIRVFRHPDHNPRLSEFKNDIVSGFSKLSLNTFNLAQMGGDALEGLYGSSDDVVLFWAHHEKLCLVDAKLAFMGGLDMCFGRWDTQSHPIADAHPENLDEIVFPGQDYNNARVYDFEDVSKWESNKLDRTKSSRMGWSDISISLAGPVVNSLKVHFTERWNFIHNQKYKDREYQALDGNVAHVPAPDMTQRDRGDSDVLGDIGNRLHRRMHGFFGGDGEESEQPREQPRSGGQDANLNVQVVRSSCGWSAGTHTEHSIADAYRSAILNAEHFVYIENQFFITATSDEQHPVANKIGAAIVERIVRAHREGAAFHITVVMPAVPAFAGDLQAEGALGTRAIMEFQYNSINRGGHSIVQALQAQGVSNPEKYIGFYNLRSYDRINVSGEMRRAEEASGVRYEDARREHDDAVNTDQYSSSRPGEQYQQYQNAAPSQPGTWDTVSSCYMNDSPALESVPWPSGNPESEADAFVSEELYVHSKVLIADDRLVICGSANLNDRSQLGTHDSEIAVVIEDNTSSPDAINSTMNGQPYRAGRFASSLRRTLYQKHLGLLPDQRHDRPDAVNWSPVASPVVPGEGSANAYDWDSPADALVSDPLSSNFLKLWTATARENTAIFSDVFQCVPNDKVRTWADYDSFFSRHFTMPGLSDEEREKLRKKDEEAGGEARRRVEYGHVPWEARERLGGVRGVKEQLGRVRGNLVEMPLGFLIEVDDIAKEGLTLNALTDELYT